MKKILVLACIFLSLSVVLVAQSKKDVRKAREMMDYYDYNGATTLLENAMKSVKTINPDAVDALAECYRRTGEIEKAERTYNWLLKMNDYNPEAHKQYGEILVYFEQYADAKDQFKKYIMAMGTNPLVERLIASCDTAMRWAIKRDSSVFHVINENALNTKYGEYGATLLKDNKNIIYFSDRPTGNNSVNSIRPYKAKRPVHDGTLAKAPRISSSLQYTNFYPDYNLGPMLYTRDGKKVYYTRNSEIKSKVNEVLLERKQIIEEATISNGNIDKVTPFGFNKPAEYSVLQPCLSPDEKVIYFVSDMPGGYGGYDIYFSMRNKQGEWCEPVNLGPEINTVGDEVYPTMDEEGILYFSSNGHPGYGNMDIFRSRGEKNKWTPVENMRAPVNSGGDDFYLKFNPGMEDGFLASNRRGGIGSNDIYSFVLSGPLPDIGYIEAPKQFIQQAILDKKSYVLEEETEQPIDSVLLCFIKKGSNVPMYVTSKLDGSFEIGLEENTDYILSAIKRGYVPVVNFEFRTGDNVAMRKFRIDLRMTPEEGQKRDKDGDAVIDEERGIYKDPEGDSTNAYNQGIVYTVQILASKEYPNWAYLEKAKETYSQYKIYYGSFPDAFTRFTIGRFRQLKEANHLKAELRSIGYNDAFVVMFIDGKRKVVAYH